MLAGMDAALAPLTSQLAAVEGINPPDFNTYATWLHNQVAIKQRLDGECARRVVLSSLCALLWRRLLACRYLAVH
jgi:hypothetical protein